MNKIRIVNWLLTRKCNLSCDYCAIVRNYKNKPEYYPDISHYHKNEMDASTVINTLKKFKLHNPDAFHLFYGGEPMLRPDLPEIIKYCNENDIHYTIISNNTDAVQPMIKNLINNVGYIQGFTSSVDPVIQETPTEDSIMKSIVGFDRLKEMNETGKIKDLVAEITVMNHNKHLLHQLLTNLSKNGICGDITFVDVAKTEYYDFSNVTDKSLLIQPDFGFIRDLVHIMDDDNLNIHMKDVLIPMFHKALPSNFDCKLHENIHNITIDADGSVRLCLRVRGILTPRYINVHNLFDIYDTLNVRLKDHITHDKHNFCRLCNHTCYMMSKYINDNDDGSDALIHTDKRGE